MSLVSELPASMAKEANLVAEKPVRRSLSSKKNQGKVPKKIHKAEREKLKRDHLNDLFLELGHALEPSRQNNGQASILGDTIRLLRDLFAHVKSLRQENAAFATESRYVTVENDELRDENLVLEAEIEKLQNELQERIQQSNSAWSNGAAAAAASPAVPQPAASALPMQQQPVVGPVYVIPLRQEFQPYPETATSPPPSHVRRPRARYPTPSDSWPLQILSHQHRTTTREGQRDGGGAAVE